MSDKKEYGLIIPNKNKHKIAAMVKKPSIFDEDSESDETECKPTGITESLKRQDRIIQQQAAEEDPTIFQYDELYDEMEQKRKESKLSRKDLDKKPKYINKLLIAAEKRKLENERRIERQVQKEREAEGNEFKDKESFVTSAYKKKLEEMKEQEELEKREEYLESIGDVTRQGNLDGFYRHLYEQKVNYDDEKEKKMDEIKKNVEANKEVEAESSGKQANKVKRHYRKARKNTANSTDSNSESSGEEKNEGTKMHTHLASNLDADSDFSIDSESDSDEEPKEKCRKVDNKEENVPSKDTTDDKEVKDEDTKEAPKKEEEKKPPKPKIDIWKKRTVGEVFIAAVERYQKRKEMRGAA